MKVPDSEGPANHTGPESCAGVGNGVGEALTGEGAGRVLSPEISQSGCRRAPNTRKATLDSPVWRGLDRPGGVGDLSHARTHFERNPGGPASGLTQYGQVRTVNPRGTTVMHGGRESDSFIVPRKPSNKGCSSGPAEKVEGRELAKGNAAEHTRDRTQRRVTPVTRARPRTAGIFGCLCVRPKAGARCGSAARRGLCGGRPVRVVPTATMSSTGVERRYANNGGH